MVPWEPVNVQMLDVDFSVFTHKTGCFACYALCWAAATHYYYIMPVYLMHEVVPSAVMAALMAAASSCSANFRAFLVAVLIVRFFSCFLLFYIDREAVLQSQ